jgi:hypothetical protein
MRHIIRTARAVVVGATFSVMFVLVPQSARADKASDAAACIAIFGGPTGAAIATLAKGNTLKQAENQFSDAKKAADASERYALKACAAYQQDPVFQAMAAALTTMVVAGELPNDYEQASEKVQHAIGKIIGALLEKALTDGNSPLHYLAAQLPADFAATLKDLIAQNATDALIELLKNNPITAPFVAYFDCGVVVATSGIKEQLQQLLDQAKQTTSDAQDCGNFLKTCTGSLTDCAAGMADLGVAIIKGAANLPGEVYDRAKKAVEAAINAIDDSLAGHGSGVAVQVNADAVCPAGPLPEHIFTVMSQEEAKKQNGQLLILAKIAGTYYPTQFCTCPAPSKVSSGKGLSATGQVNYCECDGAAVYQGGTCKLCPTGYGAEGESCKLCPTSPGWASKDGLCQQWTCAKEKPGLKLVSYGSTFGDCNYKHTCGTGKVWKDGPGGQSATGSCQVCPPNTTASYASSNKDSESAGSCRACEYNEVSKAGGACKPLVCHGLTHADKNAPHQCVPCKNVFNAGGAKLGGEFAKFGSKPICVDTQDNVAQSPCSANTVRYPDGSCRPAPKAQDPIATKKRELGPGPVERVSNPGVSGVNVRPSLAPNLDDIGGGASGGSTAPKGSAKGTPSLPSSAPSMRITPSYSAPSGNYKP